MICYTGNQHKFQENPRDRFQIERTNLFGHVAEAILVAEIGTTQISLVLNVGSFRFRFERGSPPLLAGPSHMFLAKADQEFQHASRL